MLQFESDFVWGFSLKGREFVWGVAVDSFTSFSRHGLVGPYLNFNLTGTNIRSALILSCGHYIFNQAVSVSIL